MKRFSLKVSAELFEKIKKNGTQQKAIDEAILYLQQNGPIEIEKTVKLDKQISFAIEEPESLMKGLQISSTRELLKQIRSAIILSLSKSTFGKIFKGLDADLKDILKKRIRDEWTHDSTALEGNTLTLGETSFILNEGLTISGKSLKEHDEIRGHADAIELIYQLSIKEYLTEEDLFLLHRSVIINPPFDVENPVGAWKKRENGAYWGKEYIMYPTPKLIPELMKQWLKIYNAWEMPETPTEAVKHYTWVLLTFTSIHPFFDGNGRLARLVANRKVIQQGNVPISIDSGSRFKYLDLIKNYRLKEPIENLELTTSPDKFERFIYEEWHKTLKIVDEVRAIQRSRNS